MNNLKFGDIYKKRGILKNNKGFTIIELLIVIALAAIVCAVVMSFFTGYVRINSLIGTSTELQYEARKIMGFITETAVESCEVAWIGEDYNNSVADDSSFTSVRLGIINFKGYGNNNYHSFAVSGKKIYYEKTTSDSVKADETPANLLGSFVEYIEITGSVGSTFRESNLIEVEIKLKRDKEEYRLKKNLFLRNKN